MHRQQYGGPRQQIRRRLLAGEEEALALLRHIADRDLRRRRRFLGARLNHESEQVLGAVFRRLGERIFPPPIDEIDKRFLDFFVEFPGLDIPSRRKKSTREGGY